MKKEESVFFKGRAPGRRAITPVVDPIPIGQNKLDALNYIKKREHGVGKWSVKRGRYWRSHGKVMWIEYDQNTL